AFGQTLCFDGAAWRWTDDGSIEAAAVSVPLSSFVADLAEPITRYGRDAVVIFPDRLSAVAPDVLNIVTDILERHGRQTVLHGKQYERGGQAFVVDAASWEQETARVFGVSI